MKHRRKIDARGCAALPFFRRNLLLYYCILTTTVTCKGVDALLKPVIIPIFEEADLHFKWK